MVASLYVHIPFCRHICGYCDFTKMFYEPKWALSYVQELKKEIAAFHLPAHSLKTVYLGGGTPTCLPKELLGDLLDFLSKYWDPADYECTVEGNPETIDETLPLFLKQHGVNRFSLGIESSSPRLLSLMGRHHTFADAKTAISRLKAAGLTNISADFIYALPNETMDELQGDIAAFLSLDLPHLSAYSLTVSPSTGFAHQGYHEADEQIQGAMYEMILRAFRQAGYTRYEVSNFARNHAYSRHNLTYWHDEEYAAAGLGASGYLGRVRYTNTKNLTSYLKGEWRGESETLSRQSEHEDYFLTNLRLADGFSLHQYQARFQEDFLTVYRVPLQQLEAEGLLLHEGDRIHATDRGILLLDRILLALF